MTAWNAKGEAINLSADARKKSFGETQSGSASPEDDVNRRMRSDLFHGLCAQRLAASRILFANALRTTRSTLERHYSEKGYARALSAITSRNIRKLSLKN